MSSKVTSISEKSQDNRSWNPEQMLQKALDDVRLGVVKPTSAFLIFLDESNNGYNISTRITGMSSSEQVALLEIVKHDTITSM